MIIFHKKYYAFHLDIIVINLEQTILKRIYVLLIQSREKSRRYCVKERSEYQHLYQDGVLKILDVK